MFFLVSFDWFWFGLFCQISNCEIILLLRSICLKNLFPMLYCDVMSIFDVELYFFYAEQEWILFLHTFCKSVYSYWRIECIDIERYQWPIIFNSIIFLLVVEVVCLCLCMSLCLCDFGGMRLFISCDFNNIADLLGLELFSSMFCGDKFANTYWLKIARV